MKRPTSGIIPRKRGKMSGKKGNCGGVWGLLTIESREFRVQCIIHLFRWTYKLSPQKANQVLYLLLHIHKIIELSSGNLFFIVLVHFIFFIYRITGFYYFIVLAHFIFYRIKSFYFFIFFPHFIFYRITGFFF